MELTVLYRDEITAKATVKATEKITILILIVYSEN